MLQMAQATNAGDDERLVVVRKDFSGGLNTRQHAVEIGDAQASLLYNVDVGIAGQTSKRLGSVLIGNDIGDDTPVRLHNYVIQGGTDQLLMYEDTHLWKWTGVGDWAYLKNNFTASTDCGMVSAKMSGVSPDDIVIVQNGVDNAFSLKSDGSMTDLGSTSGTGNDSPPKSTVMCWYGNRVWVLKNDLLYYSDAYSANYATAFDTASYVFRLPVGAEKILLATRDMGIVVMGFNAIWSLAPSVTPAATDITQPLLTDMGCVSKKGAVIVGDDIYFFSQDGLRALKRTVQDKLQLGASFPLSYRLKTEFEAINWAYISQLSMEYFDNKVFIAVPTGAATYDTWVYYPALDSFIVVTGWSPACWATYKVNGEERLYYGKQGDGTVYRAWYGYTDEGTTTTDGTAINYQEEGRKENVGQPLLNKIGGEVEIKVKSSGNYDIAVYASFDEADYTSLGTINMAAGTPTLDVALPFTLTEPTTISKKFHLDSYGHWKNIQLKLQHNATNASDEITVLERNITTFQEELENE